MSRVLLIGTFDTKDEELRYVERAMSEQGATVVAMDVSVLGDPASPVTISKHEVAASAGTTIEDIVALNDENLAMTAMAQGAAARVAALYAEGEIDGLIALGGTMGTDLALDCAAALPLGVPKYIVSTVSFSPLIAPQRIPPDVQMILWAGGLYGLNSICRASLSQAAGAVVGACRAARRVDADKPIVGMMSLGKSCLSYMVRLQPALEARGFELAVFHATGMGGRAFEGLAGNGVFACVMDFCLQELSNELHGSVVSAGADRLTNAGRAGVPQIVAPGATDMFDFLTWQPVEKFAGRESHAHNRLISSCLLDGNERAEVAAAIGERLALAESPSAFIMPLGGIQEWDKADAPLHDPASLAAFTAAIRESIRPPTQYVEVDAHINDAAFCDAALEIFDRWLADGTVKI
ncbi:MAG: Tm-1-like ATP-binding domain-containing protein [Pseudomonadota bacterium]